MARKKYPADDRWRTASRLAWRKTLNQLKAEPCMDCGGDFPPEVMDFDHVRGDKLFNVGNGKGVALEVLLAEIAKCDLVCANCHRIRTQKRRFGA